MTKEKLRFKVPRQHRDRLREMGLEEQWLRNTIKYNEIHRGTRYETYSHLATVVSFRDFINWSFEWSRSPEGPTFWQNVSRR